MRHCRLLLRRPSNRGISKKYHNTRDGFLVQRVTSTVRITISRQNKRNRCKRQALMNRPLKISQNPLGSLKMIRSGISYKLTSLLNSKGQIWLCKSKVLQGNNQASIQGRIRQQWTIMRYKMSIGRAGSLARFAI